MKFESNHKLSLLKMYLKMLRATPAICSGLYLSNNLARVYSSFKVCSTRLSTSRPFRSYDRNSKGQFGKYHGNYIPRSTHQGQCHWLTLVNTGTNTGLLLDGTKSLPVRVLAHGQWNNQESINAYSVGKPPQFMLQYLNTMLFIKKRNNHNGLKENSGHMLLLNGLYCHSRFWLPNQYPTLRYIVRFSELLKC